MHWVRAVLSTSSYSFTVTYHLHPRSEQSSLEGRYEEAKLRLLQKSSVEQTLQDRCQQLQAKLAESVEERECLLRRVGSADRECSDSKAEVTQLRAELRGVTAERSTLQEQVDQCRNLQIQC